MIEITKYLQTVYEDLQRYVDNDVCLCKFKELNFEAGALPDYEDINIQQLYLLRYAFAYAFEYSRMYLDVLSQMDGVNGISVTSVGCGSMIDYWSLVHALEMKRKIDCSIRYVGMGAFLYAFLHSRGSIQSTYENRFGVTSAPVEQKLEPDWVIGIP